MADGVALPASGVNAATEDYTGATRQAGSHRQEVVPAIAGAAAAPTTYNATTSSTTAVAANGLRVGLYIDNKSDTDVWLGFGQAAVISSGIRVPANGGRFSCGPEWQGTVTVIHGGSGNKAVAVQEFSA
jgi:hypothetical protein